MSLIGWIWSAFNRMKIQKCDLFGFEIRRSLCSSTNLRDLTFYGLCFWCSGFYWIGVWVSGYGFEFLFHLQLISNRLRSGGVFDAEIGADFVFLICSSANLVNSWLLMTDPPGSFLACFVASFVYTAEIMGFQLRKSKDSYDVLYKVSRWNLWIHVPALTLCLVVWWKMSQADIVGGSSNGSAKGSCKAKLRIKVPKFDNSDLIKGYSKTLIGRCMNPAAQNVSNLLLMLPRILKVDGRVAGAYLGLGKFQLDFDKEEDIVEVL